MVSVVFIKLKEVVGSNLRAFSSLIVEEKDVFFIASVLGFGKRYNVFRPGRTLVFKPK